MKKHLHLLGAGLLKKKPKAFTLVELMIAMAIIAILATAGTLAYTDYVKKSRDSARGQIAQNLNSSVMAYAASNDGNPPAADDFTEFLASAGETFGGGGVSGGGSLSLIDPVGGKNVCLDAAGNANQPCSFNYTAYDDGTYAISYGVEHESSTEENFYKTTDSVVAPGIKVQAASVDEQTAVPKYGVYVGSAKYIGQTSTTVNQNPDTNIPSNKDGVDEQYVPSGATEVQPLKPVFRSIRVDSTVGVTKIAGGSTCTQLDICEDDLLCILDQCRTSNVPSGESCYVSGQCATGLSCISEICRMGNIASGESCDVSEQCESDNCWNYTCYTCPAPLKTLGVACTEGTECVSSSCSGGVCVLTPKADGQRCTTPGVNTSECINEYCGLGAIPLGPNPCPGPSVIYYCTDGLSGASCGDDAECQSGYFCDNGDNGPGQCAANQK